MNSATGDLDITRNLTIRAVNAYLSIIDANGIDRVLDQVTTAANPRTLILEDLTITGGDSDDDGGGLRFASAVTARRIIVTRNQAFGDGAGLSAASGIGIEAGPLELRSSIVSLNVSDGFDGGGLDAGASERGVLIERSIIITNSAEILGGGIALPSFTSGDRPRLDEVIVYGNAATGPGAPRGAGVYASAGADVDQSWIGHNLAGSWGAEFSRSWRYRRRGLAGRWRSRGHEHHDRGQPGAGRGWRGFLEPERRVDDACHDCPQPRH